MFFVCFFIFEQKKSMQVKKMTVHDLLATAKTQYVIPIYQRNYDWKAKQCLNLFEDILRVGMHEHNVHHFIGTIVDVKQGMSTVPEDEVTQIAIIDGQQRLTSLTLIYIALYRLAKELTDQSLMDEIHDYYLINRYAKTEQHKLKLKTNQHNEDDLRLLLNGNDNNSHEKYSTVINNFRFFKNRINQNNYQHIRRGLRKLDIIVIELDVNDEPQRIFESLNSTGLDLTQADLIRNYILMGMDTQQQETIYKDYWEHIEKLAIDDKDNSNKVSDFIRHYLTIKNNKVPKIGDVYETFKLHFPLSQQENIESLLSELKSLAVPYNHLVNPQRESDIEIQTHLRYIEQLNVLVCYPFLMRVYADYIQKKIDKSIFIDVLELVQSFLIRRMIIGQGSNGLNHIFANLYNQHSSKDGNNDFVYNIAKSLVARAGVHSFPKDDVVKNSLKTVSIYSTGKRGDVIKYLLERLERLENNKEKVQIYGNDKITIEHIFPQNPAQRWREELEPNEYKEMETHLHTLANLTITGSNSELSNKTFSEKKKLYEESNFWLNRHLKTYDRWGMEQLKKRHKVIENRFFKIWKYPDIEVNELQYEETNIFDAEDPTNKTLEYGLLMGEKIEETDILTFYQTVMTKLFALYPEIFYSQDCPKRLHLTTKNTKENCDIGNGHYIKKAFSHHEKFNLLRKMLQLANLEEECYIKYQSEESKSNNMRQFFH